MPTSNNMYPYQEGDYIFVPKREYELTRNQLKIMFKLSRKLFDAYYGKDYYLPMSGSQLDTYEYLVNRLISDLEKRKKNIFYRIWKKIMKW